MSSNAGTKVARCIEKYDLPEMGPTLEARWTGESGERTSLRDLAEIFNRTLVEAALRDVDTRPLSVDVGGIYEALRHGSNTERPRAERRLEREGVDAEALTADFVSHKAVHTYLRRNRGASPPASTATTVENRIQTIEKLEGRVAAVAEAAVSGVPAAEDADTPAYEVLVDVKSVCTACGETYSVRDLLTRGGCRCVHADE
jgi:predicted transcriptional regulator